MEGGGEMAKLGSMLACVVLASGCSSRSAVEQPDASATSASSAATVSPPLGAHLATFAGMAPRLAELRAFTRDGASFRIVGDRAHAAASRSAGPALSVRVGPTAGDPVRLAAGDHPDLWLEIRALDVASVAVEMEDRALVLREALPSVDVLLAGTGTRFEELWLLRSARAPAVRRWALRSGPGIAALRVREGRVEAVDAQGYVRFESEAPFAVDARGVRRELSVELAEGVLVETLDRAGLVYPIAVDPSWSSASAMLSRRKYHTATRLADGRVLVTGGTNGTTTLSSAEIWDPVSSSWSALPAMGKARQDHVALLLPSGKVLVAGGKDTSAVHVTAELFDPASLSWAAASGTNLRAHSDGCATLLPGGKVLFFAGESLLTGTPTAKADLYDPATDSWSAAPDATCVYARPVCTVLATGRVYATGDYTCGSIYNAVTNTWASSGGSMGVPAGWVKNQAQALLGSGKALITGGRGYLVSGNPPGTHAYTYDEVAGHQVAPPMLGARMLHASVLLPRGDVLVSGGSDGTSVLSTTETFDPGTGTWTAGPALLAARSDHTMTVLASGDALVVGGVGASAPLSTAELFLIGALGATCAADTDCSSGICVDKVCCDTSCSSSCQACDVAGKLGTCSLVTGAVHGSRVACTGAATTCGGSCNGLSTGCAYPPATTECVSASCAAGVATPAQFCNGAGKCGSAPGTACAPYACGAVGCKITCLVDGDCAATHYCAAGSCVLKKAKGAACTTTAECASPNQCADGVCCDSACDKACEACNLSGSAGVCSKVPDGAGDPHKKCGAGPCAAGCKAGACGFKASTETCAVAACKDGVLTKSAACSGTDDLCAGASPTPCPDGLACADATACKTKCVVNTDCAAGVCDPATGKCGGLPLDGGVSDGGADLGVAETPAPDPGAKPTVGSFVRCNKASDCATGHCVDGICCDTACKERCHTCALLTSPGKCVESPVGVDLKGECGPANACFGTCGPGGACVGSGPGTMCARNRCTSPSAGVGAAFCAGAGAACPTELVPFDCAPYVCEPAFGACRSTCSTSADCINGFACDVDSGRCQAAAPAAEDSGCAMGGAAHDATAWWGLVVALGVLGRRRRASR